MAGEDPAVVTVTVDRSRADRQGWLAYAEGTIAIGAGDYYTAGLSMPASAFSMHQAWHVHIDDFSDGGVVYTVAYDSMNEVIYICTIEAPGGAGSCDKVELTNDDPMPATPSSVNFHAIGVYQY